MHSELQLRRVQIIEAFTKSLHFLNYSKVFLKKGIKFPFCAISEVAFYVFLTMLKIDRGHKWLKTVFKPSKYKFMVQFFGPFLDTQKLCYFRVKQFLNQRIQTQNRVISIMNKLIKGVSLRPEKQTLSKYSRRNFQFQLYRF